MDRPSSSVWSCVPGLTLVLALASPVASLAAASEIDPDPAARVIAYEELWRVGGPDSALQLGAPASVVSDDEGRVYVLDTLGQEVHRFTREGAPEGVIVHPGREPGQIEQTHLLHPWPASRLAVVRGYPARVFVYDLDGGFLETVAFSGSIERRPVFAVDTARRAGDVIVVQGSRLHAEGGRRQERVLMSYDATGAALEEILVAQRPRYDFGADSLTVREIDTFFAGERHALAPEGTLYVAPERNAYRIDLMSTDGTIQRSVTRDVAAVPRTAAQIAAQEDRFRVAPQPGRRLPHMAYAIESHEPVITALDVVEGQLWVRMPIEDPARSAQELTRVAIHSLDGEWIEDRVLTLAHDPELDRWHLLGDGRVAVVVGAVSGLRDAALGPDGQEEPGAERVPAPPVTLVVYGPRSH